MSGFHLIDQNIDSGAVLMYKESILPEDYIKPFHLIDYSNKKIIELYKEFLIDLKKETLKPTKAKRLSI